MGYSFFCTEIKPLIKKSAFLLVIVLFCLPFALHGCKEKPTSKEVPKETPKEITLEKTKGINIKENRLAVIPDDYNSVDNISFSEDGERVFYTARKRGKAFSVSVVREKEALSPVYDGASFLVMSPDRRRFAFGGLTGGKKKLIIDNKELKGLYHEEVAPSAFSPDGRLVACEVGGLKEKRWFILVSDGEKEIYRSKAYPETFRPPVFSPDGKLLAYELGESGKERVLFFLDVGSKKIIKKMPHPDNEQVGKTYFSSDSSKVMYELKKEGKSLLVLYDFTLNEEREIELLSYNWVGGFVLSQDGKRINYIATKDGKHFLVESPWEAPRQRIERGPYEGIVPPVFSPDSTTVAYHVVKEGKWLNIVGGKEGIANYDGVDVPVFSPNGSMIAYAAMKGGGQDRRMMEGKWFMVISPVSNPLEVKESRAYDMVVTPVFSPDSRYLAFRARRGTMNEGKRFIVIADAKTGRVIKEGKVNEEVWPPLWSPDGKCVGYGVRNGRELWWKVEEVP